jgi:pimeloyl-ACP methyl ester carboxylesterase
MEMHRRSIVRDGLRLSLLDVGQPGATLVALHAHWMEAATFRGVAARLQPAWRVVAPDQRGHGFSDHAARYARADYLDDLDALLDHLELQKVVLLGNSLGGVNAYQYAARRPGRVAGLVIEDIGVEIDDDVTVGLKWRGTFPTRAALEAAIGARLLPALGDGIRETADGWRLAFDPAEVVASQAELNGDHWRDWLASRCPALVMRGKDSPLSKPGHLRAMAERRPGTRFVEIDGGHAVHVDNPDGFVAAVKAFLAPLEAQWPAP